MSHIRKTPISSHHNDFTPLRHLLRRAKQALLLLLLMPSSLHGETEVVAPGGPLPRLKVPYTNVAPALKADPDEAIWQKAAVIPKLPLSIDGPAGGSPMPTAVRVLWNDEHLFIRFQSVTKEILTPHGTLRDADHHHGDVVEIFLDPVGDNRQVFEIQVNPRGGILDILWLATADPESDELGALTQDFHQREWWAFRHWDILGLRVANHLSHHKEGGIAWTCDVAIPAEALFRRLGRRTFENQQLRVNFLRYDGPADVLTGRRKEEIFMNWSPVRHGCPHISPERLGILELHGRPAEKEPEEKATSGDQKLSPPSAKEKSE